MDQVEEILPLLKDSLLSIIVYEFQSLQTDLRAKNFSQSFNQLRKSFKLTVFVFLLAPSDDGAISASDELLHVVRRQAHGQ